MLCSLTVTDVPGRGRDTKAPTVSVLIIAADTAEGLTFYEFTGSFMTAAFAVLCFVEVRVSSKHDSVV